MNSPTTWAAQDSKYNYRIAASSPSPYEGYIYRRTWSGNGEMVFSWTYSDLAAAKKDLAERGAKDYFVKPTDPVPAVPPPPPPPEPVENLAPGYVLDEEDVTAFDVVDATADELDNLVTEEATVEAATETPHKIEIYRDSAGEFRWRRRAANGVIISNSTESYPDKRDCLHGLQIANTSNYVLNDQTGESA